MKLRSKIDNLHKFFAEILMRDGQCKLIIIKGDKQQYRIVKQQYFWQK